MSSSKSRFLKAIPHDRVGLVQRILLALYIVALFLLIPLLPELNQLAEALLPPRLIPGTVTAFYLGVGLFVAGGCCCGRPPRRWWRLLALVTLTVLAVAGIWALRDAAPARALYLPAYGVLALLALPVYRRREPDAGAYWCAGLLASLVGTLTEVTRWLLLEGQFSFGAVALRAAGGWLMIGLVAWVLRPPAYAAASSPRSARLALRLAVVQLLLLGLCISTTAERLQGITARWPALAWLQRANQGMIEYGHRYHDPEIGFFYSRLSLPELAEQDRTRSFAVAAILDAYPFPDREAEFLAEYPPARDPFVYEVRHRIDRRDRYLFYANRLEDYEQEEWWVPFLTIAYQEHRILELLFPRTWNASGYTVSDRNLNRMRAYHDPATSFHNETDRHLVAPWRETHFWGMIVVGLTLCWLWYRHHQRASVS